MGFVGKDPEERATASGKKVTSFSMGVNTKKGSEKVTSWYKVNCWGNSFECILSKIKKGNHLVVMGRFNTPYVYSNKNGEEKVDLSLSCDSIDFVPGKDPNPAIMESPRPISDSVLERELGF